MLLLPLAWGLWCLMALKQGAPASAAFLPPSMERLFQEFSNIFEQSREALGTDRFDPSVDISKLPSDYHNEEKQQRKVGNATVYSHREISKVTDNRTGDMVFLDKMVTSIEQVDTQPEEKKDTFLAATLTSKSSGAGGFGSGILEGTFCMFAFLITNRQKKNLNWFRRETKPVVSQEGRSFETDRQSSGFRVFNFGLPQPRPRLTFLIFRLPEHLKREKMPEPNWVKEEPVSDRRHRLLAIRNGLLTAPHPVKKKALLVASNRTFVPQKRHFFFLWRKKI